MYFSKIYPSTSGLISLIVAKRTGIQVPIPFVEECEQPLEGLVRDVELGVPLLELVDVEQPTVEVRHRAQECRQVGVQHPFTRRLVEALVEEDNEEVAVEGQELTSAALQLDLPQSIA